MKAIDAKFEEQSSTLIILLKVLVLDLLFMPLAFLLSMLAAFLFYHQNPNDPEGLGIFIFPLFLTPIFSMIPGMYFGARLINSKKSAKRILAGLLIAAPVLAFLLVLLISFQ